MADHSDDRNDDLLFFVQRPEVENGGLGTDPVFVKRKVKGTKRILTTEQEAVVLWKDTFFLNVIVQVFFFFGSQIDRICVVSDTRSPPTDIVSFLVAMQTNSRDMLPRRRD